MPGNAPPPAPPRSSRETGILFSGEMVRGIIDDRKSQTRRTRKLDHVNRRPDHWRVSHWETPEHVVFVNTVSGALHGVRSPYGHPGDLLWVREAWAHVKGGYDSPEDKRAIPAWYRATDEWEVDGPWKPSIHMPRWASRLTLEITDVRVERVQDISEDDAVAEGIRRSDDPALASWPFLGATHPIKGTPKVFATATQAYHSLWDSLNAARGYGWDANPWCWALTFRRVEPSHVAS